MCRRKVRLVVSQEILDEVRHTLLHRAHLRKRFRYDDAEVDRYLRDVRQLAEIVEPATNLVETFQRDPKDTPILATIVAAKAAYLVSRDRDLRDLGQYRDTQILDPETFIHLLRENQL